MHIQAHVSAWILLVSVWQCIFSAPFFIFQYNQVACWWMLAVQLHCWSIAVASQTHSCHITVAQRPFMVVSEEQAALWWHNWHLLKVWSKVFDLMFQQNLTVVNHPTRSIELKYCTAQSVQKLQEIKHDLHKVQKYTWFKNSIDWRLQDSLYY